jgi:hypothetical protein
LDLTFVRRYSGPQEHAPWGFERVFVHRFVLPADGSRLRAVCDLVLNYKEDVSFAPLTRFVTIDVLDYPTMRPRRPAGRPMPGCGMRQQELAFHITVEATSPATGAAIGVFDFCPFVYVDNAWSVVLGRESLGYPKLLASFALAGGPLDGKPTALEVATLVCADGRGDWATAPVFHADYSPHHPTPSPDWNALEELADWEVALDRAARMGITLDNVVLAEAHRQLNALRTGLKCVQLKEFLDPVNGRPDRHLACYKALVRGGLENVRIRGASMSARRVTLGFYRYPEYELASFLGIVPPHGPDTVDVPLWFKLFLDFDGEVDGYL